MRLNPDPDPETSLRIVIRTPCPQRMLNRIEAKAKANRTEATSHHTTFDEMPTEKGPARHRDEGRGSAVPLSGASALPLTHHDDELQGTPDEKDKQASKHRREVSSSGRKKKPPSRNGSHAALAPNN